MKSLPAGGCTFQLTQIYLGSTIREDVHVMLCVGPGRS